jgi:CxxC-x17-CxxC domain-containing protein
MYSDKTHYCRIVGTNLIHRIRAVFYAKGFTMNRVAGPECALRARLNQGGNRGVTRDTVRCTEADLCATCGKTAMVPFKPTGQTVILQRLFYTAA